MQKKKRERSVKHRLHDAGGKTDGKSTLFGKFRGKAWFQKFLFSRSKTGNFIFFARILEDFWEGPNQAMVFLSSFWFFGGFRSSRFHFENNLKIMRFHLLLISMLFVWFCYYCCSYFRQWWLPYLWKYAAHSCWRFFAYAHTCHCWSLTGFSLLTWLVTSQNA